MQPNHCEHVAQYYWWCYCFKIRPDLVAYRAQHAVLYTMYKDMAE